MYMELKVYTCIEQRAYSNHQPNHSNSHSIEFVCIFYLVALVRSYAYSHMHVSIIHIFVCAGFLLATTSLLLLSFLAIGAVQVYLCWLELFWCTLLLSYIPAIQMRIHSNKSLHFPKRLGTQQTHRIVPSTTFSYQKNTTFHNMLWFILSSDLVRIEWFSRAFSGSFVFFFSSHPLRFERFRSSNFLFVYIIIIISSVWLWFKIATIYLTAHTHTHSFQWPNSFHFGFRTMD